MLLPLAISAGGGAIQLLADGIDGEAVVEEAETPQEAIAIERRQGGPVGFLDEEVEVIGHHGVGDDAEPEKGLEPAHEDDEVFALLVPEDELPVNDAGQAMVVAEPFPSDACLSHGWRGLHG